MIASRERVTSLKQDNAASTQTHHERSHISNKEVFVTGKTSLNYRKKSAYNKKTPPLTKTMLNSTESPAR